MRRRRRILLLPILLLAAPGLLWLGQHWFSQRRPARQLVAGQWYTVETSSDAAAIDLSFEHGERYLLVVNSLGSSSTTYEVSLAAEGIAGLESTPVVPVRPLPPPVLEGADELADSREQVQRVAAVHAQEQREFFLHVTDGDLQDPNSYARVVGRLVGEGDDIRVYLDRQLKRRDLTPGLVDEIIDVMDRQMIPAMAERLGTYCDVDGDGKFAILLSPWLNRLQGGRTSLGGFVRGSDFQGELESPFSNRCDVMYLNSSLTPGKHLNALLAHEFTHAICFSERLHGGPGGARLPDEEDWLNEALAHLSENMFAGGWSNLDHRVNELLNAPHEYPLVVRDYYRAGLWRNHGCRGATYLFLRWWADQFGEQGLQRLIRCPDTGTRNLSQVAGVSFEELFRRWSIALTQGTTDEAPDAYETLDLCGELGRWTLAGPRVEPWDVTESTRQFKLVGTSSFFTELHAGANYDGVRRIHIAAEPGAQLQVSVQKQPATRPRLDVKARWLTAGSKTPRGAVSSEKSRHVALELALNTGAEFQVESITFEPRGPQPARQLRYRGFDLQNSALAWNRTGGDRSGRQVVVPMEPQNRLQKGCIIKVAVRDSHGQRITLRRPLGASDEWLSQFAFADSTRSTTH